MVGRNEGLCGFPIPQRQAVVPERSDLAVCEKGRKSKSNSSVATHAILGVPDCGAVNRARVSICVQECREQLAVESGKSRHEGSNEQQWPDQSGG